MRITMKDNAELLSFRNRCAETAGYERLVQPRAYGESVAVRTATEMFSLILVFFYLHLDVSGRLFLLL